MTYLNLNRPCFRLKSIQRFFDKNPLTRILVIPFGSYFHRYSWSCHYIAPLSRRPHHLDHSRGLSYPLNCTLWAFTQSVWQLKKVLSFIFNWHLYNQLNLAYFPPGFSEILKYPLGGNLLKMAFSPLKRGGGGREKKLWVSEDSPEPAVFHVAWTT